MNLPKKFLFFLLAVPILLTNACGGDNQSKTKVGKNGECNAEKSCEANLLCVATNAAGTTGTCKEEKSCHPTSAKQDCTDPAKNSCIEVQGIGTKLNICGSSNEESTEKLGKGETCTKADACKPNLLCIATDAAGTTGTCKEEKSCNTTSAKQDCTDPAKNSCIEVQGIGTKLNICGSSKTEATEKLGKGETCTKADACKPNLLCIATDAAGTTGTCKEEKSCHPTSNNQECTDPTKNSCIEVQGIGTKLNICGVPVPKQDLAEGEACTSIDTCAQNLKCIAKANETTGVCKVVVPCNDKTGLNLCNKKGYEVCVDRIVLSDNNSQVKVCDASDPATKAEENEYCFADEQCADGFYCLGTPGTSTGICRSITACNEDKDCTNTHATVCSDFKTIDGKSIKGCDGSECGPTKGCPKDDYVCYSENGDYTKGTCRPDCDQITDACKTNETCQAVSNLISMPDPTNQWMTPPYGHVCLPKTNTLPLSGWCTAADAQCSKGLVCAEKQVCTYECPRHGFVKECGHPDASYCTYAEVGTPGSPDTVTKLVCGPAKYMKSGNVADGGECDEINDVCGSDSLCVKKAAEDTKGTCHERSDKTQCTKKSKVSKELILPYSDFDMEICTK